MLKKKISDLIANYVWLKYTLWGLLAIGLIFLIIGLITGGSFSFTLGLILATLSSLVLLVGNKGWAGFKQGGLIFAVSWIVFHIRNHHWLSALWWVGALMIVWLASSFILMLISKQPIGSKIKSSFKYALPILAVWLVWSNWDYIKNTPERWKKEGSSKIEETNTQPGTGTTSPTATGKPIVPTTITPIPPVVPLLPPVPVTSSLTGEQQLQIANAYLRAAEASQQAARLNSQVSEMQMKALAEQARAKEETPEERNERIRLEAYKNSQEVKRLKGLEPFILK